MDPDSMKNVLDEVCDRFQAPSYSASMWYNGSLYHLGKGFSNIESGIHADSDTIYAIGSVTKSFTAGTICALCDAGILALDDPVRRYLPELEMHDRYVSDNLTIRDMLCHRCGLPRHELCWFTRLASLTEKELIDLTRHLKPSQPFRYAFQYSNLMFALAGFLISSASGMEWQKAMRHYLLEPMGMTDVYFSHAQAAATGRVATPYLYREQQGHQAIPPADIGVMGAAGCLLLSSSQLIRWAGTLLNKGMCGTARVLSTEMAQEMLHANMLMEPMPHCPTNDVLKADAYSLGLDTGIFRNHRIVHHDGHIDGFLSDLLIMPDDDFAIVCLTNLGQSIIPYAMRTTAMEHVLGYSEDWSTLFFDFQTQQAAESQAGRQVILEKRNPDAEKTVSDDSLCGEYDEPAYGTIEIRCKDEILILSIGTAQIPLLHYQHQYYHADPTSIFPDAPLIEAFVDLDVDGNILGFAIQLEPELKEKIYFTRTSRG